MHTLAFGVDNKCIKSSTIPYPCIRTCTKENTLITPKKIICILYFTVFCTFTEVDDIVGATLFLLSDKADMVNGVILPVDGGISDVL